MTAVRRIARHGLFRRAHDARGAVAALRSDLPRDDQRHPQGEPFGRHQERTRLLRRSSHPRPPADQRRGRTPHPHHGARPLDARDRRPLRRHRGRRRVSQQLPLFRRHPPCRSGPRRARLHRGPAALLGAGALPPRRHGRTASDHLPSEGGHHLRGGAALPLRPRRAGLQEQGGHRPDRAHEDPREQGLARRLPGPARLVPDCRAAP